MEKLTEFLVETLSVQTYSGQEKRMKKFVREHIKSLGLKSEHDNKGNIYCHKGDKRKHRPFVVAHMDTVHKVNPKAATLVRGDLIFAFDDDTGKQYGVGGDDKVGIWAALCALSHFENISVAFFVDEERGCVGSKAADMNQFKKANWIAQLDRREHSDFIVSDMASQKFQDDMGTIIENYGMKLTTQSTITDSYTLVKNGVGVSGCNIASGYYRPHSDSEVVKISQAIRSLTLLFEMIEKFGGNKYDHEIPKPEPVAIPSYSGSLRNASQGSMILYRDNMKKIWLNEYSAWACYNRDGAFAYYESSYGSKIKDLATLLQMKWNDIGVTSVADEYSYDSETLDDYYDNRYASSRNYHDFELEDFMDKQRRLLDSALFLFGVTFSEFLSGDINKDFKANISAYLFNDTGKTLAYYEDIFGVVSDDSSHETEYKNCGKSINDNLIKSKF
jgi:transcription antitermination factor NusG